jgi:hypothetical protein
VEKIIAPLAEDVRRLKELSEQKTGELWMPRTQPETPEGQQQVHAQGRNQMQNCGRSIEKLLGLGTPTLTKDGI